METTVNERIKEARKAKNYTQSQAGELIGMKCSTYSQMERQGNISVEMALALAKILGADPFYIIFGKPKEKLIPDFTPVPSEVLTANEPESFLEKIKNGEDELILTHQEKNFIKNYRLLNDTDKLDVRKYLENKRK